MKQGGVKMGGLFRKEKSQGIEWDKFETEFVRFQAGVSKRLKLSAWRQGDWLNMPGLRLDVLEEDGIPVRKILSTTSKRLIRALKPLIQRAEEQNKRVLFVTVTKIGEGLNTTYEAQELG